MEAKNHHHSAILNPHSPFYPQLKPVWDKEYEDNYWAEDAIFMERNSRDFVSRIDRINANAEAVCEVLRQNPRGTSRALSTFPACATACYITAQSVAERLT